MHCVPSVTCTTQKHDFTCSSVWGWTLKSKIYDSLGMPDMLVHGSNNSQTLGIPDFLERPK